VASVTGDNGGNFWLRALGTHVVVGGPIEVVVGPLSKSVLAKLIGGAMVVEAELRVGFEELGLLHLYSYFN